MMKIKITGLFGKEEEKNLTEAVNDVTVDIPENGDTVFYIFNDPSEVEKIEEASGMDMDEIVRELTGSEDNWGYADEWASCGECRQVVRTSPTHWGWTPDYYSSHGELICRECMLEDKETYIEYLKNNPRKANTMLHPEHLKELGFKKFNGTFVTGFHEGQNDSPEEMFEALKDEYDEVIFHIDASGQFDTEWEVWVR